MEHTLPEAAPAARALRTALHGADPLPDASLVLGDLGVLAVSGPDAIRFLQGYATCDLNALAPDRSLRGAFCNQKGRVLSTFLALTAGSEDATTVLLVLHRELVEATRAMLARYAIFSKVELAADDRVVHGVTGTAALEAVAAALGAAVPAPGAVVGDTLRLLHLPQGQAGLLLRPAQADLPEAVAALPDPGEDAWTALAVARGIADVGPLTSLEHVPQALNLPETDGVSFTKGCYLGQEIVARLEYRGRAKQRLFRLGSSAPVPADAAPVGTRVIDAGGRDVGEVVSRVVPGADAPAEALAVLRADVREPLHLKGDDERNAPAPDGDGESAAWAVLPLPYAIPEAEDEPASE